VVGRALAYHRLLVGGGSHNATGGMRLFGLEMFFRGMAAPDPVAGAGACAEGRVHRPRSAAAL